MSLYLGNNLISGVATPVEPTRNIGQIIQSTLPLTDAGLHLLDGSLISGGGIYQGFVNYIANLYNANRTLTTVVVRPIAISEGYELGSNPDDTCTATSNNSFNTGSSPYYIQYDTSTSGESSSSSSSPDEHGIVIDDPIDVPSLPDPICLPANTEITFNNLGIFDYTFTTSQGDVTITFQILFDQCTYTGVIPNYFCTGSEWQQSVNTYGVCGKFVYDSVNNTVRLPKLTGIVEGTTDLTALGDLVEAGLPNITGEVQPHYSYLRLGTYNGYGNFDTPGTAAWGSGAFGNSTNTGGISFDASLSNAIYGNSSTVQPQTIKVLYYIVVATSSKTDIQVDIDEIATDLNGKADTDLSNVPTSKGILTESYVNGASWYRVYSDGWCEQGGRATVPSGSNVDITFLKPFINTDYYVNGNQTYNWSSNPGGYINAIYGMPRTTGFSMRASTGPLGSIWFACGYIS